MRLACLGLTLLALVLSPVGRAAEVLRLDFENGSDLAQDTGPNAFTGTISEVDFFNTPPAQSSDVHSGSSGTGSVQFTPTDFEKGHFIEFIDDQFPNFTADDSFNVSLWVKPTTAFIADGNGFRGIIAGITDSGASDWQIDNGNTVDGGAGDGTTTGARLNGPPTGPLFPNGELPEGDLVADQWTQISIAFVGPAKAAIVSIGDETNPLSISAAASGGAGFAIESLTVGGNRNATTSNGATPAGRLYEGLIDEVVVTDTALIHDGSGSTFQPGDLNFSGGIPDLTDYLAFRAGQGADLSAETLLGGYGMGDVDFDGDNDLADFVAFKTLFNNANGAGSFELAAASVPEPSAIVLTLVAAGGLFGIRRRRNHTATSKRAIATTQRLTMKNTPLYTLALAILMSLALTCDAVAQEVRFDFGNGAASPNNSENDGLGNFIIAEDQLFGAAPGDLTQIIDGVQMTIRPIIATGADFAGSAWGANSQGIGIRSNDSAGTSIETGANGPDRRVDGSIGEGIQFFFDTDVALSSVRLGSFAATAALPTEVAEISYVSGGTDPFAGGSFTIETDDVATMPATDLPISGVFVTAGTILNISTTVDETVGGGFLLNGLNVFIGDPPSPLELLVDAGSGDISLINNNTDPLDIDYLRITSADTELDGGSLAAGSYTGLAGAAGFPAGSDDGTGWEAADANDDLEIIESFLTGSSVIPNDGQPISLGNAFALGGTQDLTFTYHLAGTPADAVVGNITYVAAPGLAGDYNGDNVVDAADYVVWRNNLGGDEAALNGNGDGSGTVDTEDYTRWKNNFGATLGSGSLSAGQAVPEPSSICLALCIAMTGGALVRRPRA